MRVIDGRCYAQAPDGKWYPTDPDAPIREKAYAEKRRAAAAKEPTPHPASSDAGDFVLGITIGLLF